jgi:hypothetical protein
MGVETPDLLQQAKVAWQHEQQHDAGAARTPALWVILCSWLQRAAKSCKTMQKDAKATPGRVHAL